MRGVPHKLVVGLQEWLKGCGKFREALEERAALVLHRIVTDGGGLGVVEGPGISTNGVTTEWYLAGAKEKLLGTECDAMVACLLQDVKKRGERVPEMMCYGPSSRQPLSHSLGCWRKPRRCAG